MRSSRFVGRSRGSSAGGAGVALALCLALLPALPSPATGQQPSRSPQPKQERLRSAPAGFWEAIKLDDVNKLQTEMLRGASANAWHPEWGPAIVAAARERSLKVLAYLARLSGTVIDAQNTRKETALMLAALHGDLASVRLLVERGAEVNRPDWTALHYAAANGHVPVLAYLIDQHAFIDAESQNGTNALMMAARHKHTTAVRALVEAGADPSRRNEAGMTAADYMAAHGETQEAQWLRERAAEYVARYGTVERFRAVGSTPLRSEPAPSHRNDQADPAGPVVSPVGSPRALSPAPGVEPPEPAAALAPDTSPETEAVPDTPAAPAPDSARSPTLPDPAAAPAGPGHVRLPGMRD